MGMERMAILPRGLAAAALAGALAMPVGAAPADEARPYPMLVTAETRANPQALAALEKPGKVLFTDQFESPASLERYFEINGLREGRARLTTDPALAHTGQGAFQFTAPARAGQESSAGAHYWFGPQGYDRVYFRRYLRFAADYDQGNLHHVGGGLAGVAGSDRWAGMGGAGIRPRGDDRFSSSFEPWKDWGRYSPPGYLFLYTYWMDMKRDRDGHYWGNMLGPDPEERLVLRRDRWYCLEQMIQVNDIGQANGELAAWVDGKLYLHYRGIRWRSHPDVKLKRFHIGLYVHEARRDNRVWYDDVALSTGYLGPIRHGGTARQAPPPAGRR